MFFESWALWQKLTFVLACALALTICVGLTKRWTTSRKLSDYAALTPQVPGEAIKPPAKTAATVDNDDVEAQIKTVPFGIHAVQSGIEVGGIWISPSISPASSRGSSPRPGSSQPQRSSQLSVDKGSMLHHEPNEPLEMPLSSNQVAISSRSAEKLQRHDSHVKQPPAFAPRIHFADSVQFEDSASGSTHHSKRASKTLKSGPASNPHDTVLDLRQTPSTPPMRQTPSSTYSASSHDERDIGLAEQRRLSQVASIGQLYRRQKVGSEDSGFTASSIDKVDMSALSQGSGSNAIANQTWSQRAFATELPEALSSSLGESTRAYSDYGSTAPTPATTPSHHPSLASSVSVDFGMTALCNSSDQLSPESADLGEMKHYVAGLTEHEETGTSQTVGQNERQKQIQRQRRRLQKRQRPGPS